MVSAEPSETSSDVVGKQEKGMADLTLAARSMEEPKEATSTFHVLVGELYTLGLSTQ